MRKHALWLIIAALLLAVAPLQHTDNDVSIVSSVASARPGQAYSYTVALNSDEQAAQLFVVQIVVPRELAIDAISASGAVCDIAGFGGVQCAAQVAATNPARIRVDVHVLPQTACTPATMVAVKATGESGLSIRSQLLVDLQAPCFILWLPLIRHDDGS